MDHVRGKSSWTHPVTGESCYVGAEGDVDVTANDIVVAPPNESAYGIDEITSAFDGVMDGEDHHGLPSYGMITSRASGNGDWIVDEGNDDVEDDISRTVEKRSFAEVSLL